MFSEHDQIVLTENLPGLGLEAGDVGVVIHVHQGGAAFEVEFLTLSGETAGLATLQSCQVRNVGKREIYHVRELLAA